MDTRQTLLSVIDTLPDKELASLVELARVLSLKQSSVESSGESLDLLQLADLRSRLSQFAEEWDSPEMEIYDAYDAHKSQLSAGCPNN
jgi:hypothetical protein